MTPAGSVEREHDASLRLGSLKVGNTGPIAYTYDDDSQLIGVGALQITRDPDVGREVSTTLGAIKTERTYNAFGEPETWKVEHDGVEVFFESYVYNKLGWISELERRVHGGAGVLHHYAYDPRGRLEEVSQNGDVLASYTYDANSNRPTYDGPSCPAAGTYDARDRLLTYGDATYAYTPIGDLSAKTIAGQTTTYDYDTFGNLRHVELPSGIEIDYVIDALQRRVGKKVDGVHVQGWLYQSPLQPITELDGAGHLVTRFVYATRLNVPDYLIKAGTTYRVVADHLGSPRLIIDVATGQVAQELRYDEFGRILLNTNSGFQPLPSASPEALYDASERESETVFRLHEASERESETFFSVHEASERESERVFRAHETSESKSEPVFRVHGASESKSEPVFRVHERSESESEPVFCVREVSESGYVQVPAAWWTRLEACLQTMRPAMICFRDIRTSSEERTLHAPRPLPPSGPPALGRSSLRRRDRA